MSAQGGMSYSNNFVVKFTNDSGENLFEFLCDEAQLPNVQAASGTLKGRYMGEGQVNYAHTRIFSEFQLGFMCDANLEPLKFLNKWFGEIFGELPDDSGKNMSLEKHQSQDNLKPYNRTNALAYPEQYCSNIIVTKTESGPKSTTQRAPVSYILERAWPYAIDAVPLQFGASQITKVSAQFYYARHQIVFSDNRTTKNDVSVMDNEFYPNYDKNGNRKPGGYRSVVTGSAQTKAGIEAAQQSTGQRQLNQANAGIA